MKKDWKETSFDLTYLFERFNLALGSALASRNDGTRVAHATSRRSCDTSDE
jgi:hypothetical protein